MTSIGASAARAALPDLLNRVERERSSSSSGTAGQLRSWCIPTPSALGRATEVLEDARRLRGLLDEAAAEPFSGTTRGLTTERAEELIASIRADRAAR